MKIPSYSECEELIKQFGMPVNVRAHTDKVREVSAFLAERIGVDEELVDKAALLHDVAKIYCVRNDCIHTKKAREILAGRGYPEFGRVLEEHGLEQLLDFNESTLLESKIVWYADKRVNHDKIVSLKERYEYLKERYGSISGEKMKEILSTEKKAYALEKELLQKASVKSDLEGLK